MTPLIEDIVGAARHSDLGPLPGTEDFSYVSENVPSLYVFLGTGAPGWPNVHTPDMRHDESA